MTPRARRPGSKAFTLVELLIAAAIGAAIITAAVVGFGVISNLSSETGSVNVSLPAGAIGDLYGSSSSFITVAPAPNYFQGIQARLLKSRLLDDVSAGNAVFCLGRSGRGSPSARPLSLDASGIGDFRNVTSPSAFREAFDGQLGAFSGTQDGALSTAQNASIFVLGALNTTDPNAQEIVMTVVSIYEVDFVPTSQPAGGTFATVRRFSGTNNTVPTDYYHAFYPNEANGAAGFRPLSVFFGRAGAGGGAFAIAPNHPFSFVWWPDPLISKLSGATVPAGSGVPASYANMAGRTGLFFVLPTFPSL